MPRYRVLKKSWLVDRIVHEGEEVDFDGKPGSNLLPLDAPEPKAEKPKAERKPREPKAEKPAAAPAAADPASLV